MGPPVARSAANSWAPGLENLRRNRPAGDEPTVARVWPKPFPCKSLSECCEARAGAEPGLVVNWYLGLENIRRNGPAGVDPTAVSVLLKRVPSKSLSECCEGPK